MSLRMAASKPVFGFGPETFQAEFGQWESEELARLYPDFHHESPHNTALDALVSAGIPGLLLALAWGVLGLAAAWWRRGSSRMAAPLGAAIVASGVTSLFDAASLAPVLLTLLAIAMLVALETPEIPEASARAVAGKLVLVPVGMLLAAVFAMFATHLAAGDYLLVQFQRAPSGAAWETARRWRLPGAAEDIYCSRVLLNLCSATTGIPQRIGCWRTAEQVAAEATRTSDDPANAWYNLALFTALPNDARGTEMALTRASAISPQWFKPHWTLAKLLAQNGDWRRALVEAERAAALDGKRDPEVAETLREMQGRGR